MFPDERASKIWSHDGLTFYLVAPGGVGGVPHYCGYVKFRERPMKEPGYKGILTYAPVHGGITYAEKDDGGMVYGFDCGHAGDYERPELQNEEWLGEECFRMARAIQLAAKYEDDYLTANDEARAKVIQRYHDELATQGLKFDLKNNFGAMINVLFGDL